MTNWWETKNATEFRNSGSTLLMEALACCCAVTYVNGSLIGDPLDVKMFQSTKWILNESQPTKNKDEKQSFAINVE